MNILQLNLHKKWFDEIASGIKTIEYREIKPHWEKRIENRNYDVIRFRNGYQKDAPVMIVKYHGYKKGRRFYRLFLGKIIEKS